MRDDNGEPARQWLTAIEDDHSRAIAGYAVNLDAPSALTTALAFRHPIWRKNEPGRHVCGIPSVFHLDHGSDFTSAHLEQVIAHPPRHERGRNSDANRGTSQPASGHGGG